MILLHLNLLTETFFKKFLVNTCPILGPLVLLFWISGDVSSGFQSQSGFCLIFFFAEANVMYMTWYPRLVLHELTSWWPVQSQSLPHMHVQRWDLAWIGTGNHPDRILPLCQRPDLKLKLKIELEKQLDKTDGQTSAKTLPPSYTLCVGEERSVFLFDKITLCTGETRASSLIYWND